MATHATFTPQVLGETEKALNAILYRHLDATGLSEHQWIVLQLTVAAGGKIGREQLVGRLAGALKVDAARAETQVDEMMTAGLLRSSEEGQVAVAEPGAQAHARVRGEVNEVMHRLWGDLPADDLQTTGRTLTTILERANAQIGTP